jgi:hypothetical protein
MEVKFHGFSTSAPDRGSWTILRPSHCSMRTDRQTDRQTDGHEIRNSANAHKKSSSRFIQISRLLHTSIIGMLSVHHIHPRSSFKQSRYVFCITWQRKVENRVYKSLPMDISLSHKNPIDIMASCMSFASEIVPQNNSYEALCNTS